MGNKRVFVAGILGLFLIAPAFADEQVHLETGMWQLGGGGNFHVGNTWFTTSGNSTFELNFAVSPEYFVSDSLSLGLKTGVTYDSYNVGPSSSVWRLGPSATYYFAVLSRVAYYANFNAQYHNSTSASHSYTANPGLGLNFFVTPSVAIGPVLEYSHRFGTGQMHDANTVDLSAYITVYL
jgi:hypothetical protein